MFFTFTALRRYLVLLYIIIFLSLLIAYGASICNSSLNCKWCLISAIRTFPFHGYLIPIAFYDDYVVLRRKGMLQYPPPTPFMVVIVVPLFSVWLLPILLLLRRICSTPYTTRYLPTASATNPNVLQIAFPRILRHLSSLIYSYSISFVMIHEWGILVNKAQFNKLYFVIN